MRNNLKWEVMHDGLSLGMLYNNETRRIFGLKELGADGKPWGNPIDNDALCDTFCSALNAAQPSFKATHRHAEGGLYQVLDTKLQTHLTFPTEDSKGRGIWRPAVRYRNEQGEEFVRQLVDFEDRFIEIINKTPG